MKLIFLDIDGVLNSQEFLHKNSKLDLEPDAKWWASAIEPERMALLNALVAATGALVVVSSTWRYGKSVEDLQEILGLAGFFGHVVGKTPRADTRGQEIDLFLQSATQPIEAFVCLDDDTDMAPVEDCWVRCYDGLAEDDLEEAISILCCGWENVCRAIVGVAADQLDGLYTDIYAEGGSVSSEEVELWDQAHEMYSQLLDQATFGSVSLLTDLLATEFTQAMEEE